MDRSETLSLKIPSYANSFGSKHFVVVWKVKWYPVCTIQSAFYKQIYRAVYLQYSTISGQLHFALYCELKSERFLTSPKVEWKQRALEKFWNGKLNRDIKRTKEKLWGRARHTHQTFVNRHRRRYFSSAEMIQTYQDSKGWNFQWKTVKYCTLSSTPSKDGMRIEENCTSKEGLLLLW